MSDSFHLQSHTYLIFCLPWQERLYFQHYIDANAARVDGPLFKQQFIMLSWTNAQHENLQFLSSGLCGCVVFYNTEYHRKT